MSTAIANQMFLAFLGRPADAAWLSSTAALLNGNQPSAALQGAFYNAAISEGVFSATDSTSALVNKIFQQTFGFGASTFEQTAWSNLVTNGTVTKETLAWTIFKSYLGATNVPDAYKLPTQSKLIAIDAYTTQLGNDAAANLALAQGGGAATLARAYAEGVTSQATAASAVSTVAASVASLTAAQTGTTYTLTTGGDTVPGTANNDVINAGEVGVVATFSSADSINGGGGFDTLNISQSTVFAGVPAGATVIGVETVNVTSGANVAINTASGFTGLTALNVQHGGVPAGGSQTVAQVTAAATSALTVTGTLEGGTVIVNGGSNVTVTETSGTVGGGAINVGTTTAAAGTVTVSSATSGGGLTAANIFVTGGTTIAITQTQGSVPFFTNTNGFVSVVGNASTTGVTVTNAAAATASATAGGVITGTVSITDVNNQSATAAGTITSATVSNYNTLNFGGNALTTLSVAGGSGNINIDNQGLTTATNKTLGVTVNGLTGGILDDDDIYTTLNVTTTGANSTLANVTTGAATALTVAGSKVLTLSSTAGLSALKTVAVSGTAGITATFAQSTLTGVDTSASSGATTVTIDATKAAFTGGAGVDKVTTSAAAPTKAISLGAGDDTLTLFSGTTAVTGAFSGGDGLDTLDMVAADAVTASASATFATKVTGFEYLTLTGATGTQAVDVAALGGFSKVTSAASAGTLTLNNLASGGTLAITGDTAGTGYVVGVTNAATGTADVLNLSLTKAGLLTAGSVTAANVETVIITTADTQTTPTNPTDTLTLVATGAATVSISGNAGLNLTGTANVALTSLDASGITKGDFTFTSGALAAAAAIKGSATGTNTVTFSAAVNGAVTYTGGTGNDVVTASNGKNNIISLGDGTNSVTGAAGNNTITGGAGADTVTLTTGNNVVNLGNGANAFTATTGNNTYVGGTGVDTISVGGGLNTITTGTGADVVTITAAGANVNVYSTITDAHAGLSIAFTNLGTETFVSAQATLAPTAMFQDYANAVVAGATQADHSLDGAFGWFQFSGNTYLVQVRHDTTGGINQTFVNGTDQIVALTGLIDLSTLTGGTTNILTFA